MSRCTECNLVGGCWCETVPLELLSPAAHRAVEPPRIGDVLPAMPGWIDVTGDLTRPAAPTKDWSTLAELREFVRSHGLNIFVEWGESGRNLGWTEFRAGVAVGIVFSRTLWPLLTPAERFDTAAHETAHALLPREAVHGSEWKVLCRKLGGNAERSTTLPEHVERAISKWEGRCKNGHVTFRLALTKKARIISCGKCTPTWNPDYRFNWRQLR